MHLTPDEGIVIARAVEAYRKAKAGQKGQFRGPTADQILEELRPGPIRWINLAAFVIETADGPKGGKG